MPKCKLNPKHKWEWVKNLTMETTIGQHSRFSQRGQYRCACGLIKYGPANPNDNSDNTLMKLVDALVGNLQKPKA